MDEKTYKVEHIFRPLTLKEIDSYRNDLSILEEQFRRQVNDLHMVAKSSHLEKESIQKKKTARPHISLE